MAAAEGPGASPVTLSHSKGAAEDELILTDPARRAALAGPRDGGAD